MTRKSCSLAVKALKAQTRLHGFRTASQPCAESARPPPSLTKSRKDGAWACFRRPRKRKPQVCSPLACFTASEITNHPVSFTTATFSPPPAERRRTTEMGVFQTPRWACDHRFVPPLFLVAVPGDLIPASPRYEVGKGAAFDAAAHVRLRGMPYIRSVLCSHKFRVRIMY